MSTTEITQDPPVSPIERVGVIGCGLMGSGIAEVCARAGLDVVVKEYDADAAERGLRRVTGSLDTAVGGGGRAPPPRGARAPTGLRSPVSVRHQSTTRKTASSSTASARVQPTASNCGSKGRTR